MGARRRICNQKVSTTKYSIAFSKILFPGGHVPLKLSCFINKYTNFTGSSTPQLQRLFVSHPRGLSFACLFPIKFRIHITYNSTTIANFSRTFSSMDPSHAFKLRSRVRSLILLIFRSYCQAFFSRPGFFGRAAYPFC